MLKKYWPLITVVLIGLALRLSHNIGISIWHDEAFSALMIKYPWKEMFVRLAMDVHPPMYYIVLRLWNYVFGDGVWALRGFSILFGFLIIPATYLFVKEAFHSPKMALWAAILAAVNPYTITFSTEARMYTFGAFFAVMAAYFLVKALREEKKLRDDDKLNMPNLPQDIKLKKEALWNYFGFAICSAVIILTHYYLLFTAAAIMLYGLIYCFYHYRKDYKKYLVFLISCVLVAICFLPWLRQFLGQLKSVGGSYWIPDMTVWSIPSTLWTMLLGFANDTSKSSTQFWLIVATLFTVFFLWRFVKKTDQFEKWLVVLAIVTPFLGSVLFYLKSISCSHTGVGGSLVCHGRSVYEDRYFLFSAVFFSMALAAWFAELKRKVWGALLFTAYVVCNLFATWNYWNSLGLLNRPGMAGAAAYLHANVGPGQYVFLGTSFEFFNYKYYEQQYDRTPNPPLLYTGGRSDASQMSSVEGSAMLDNADLAAHFSPYGKPGDTEWVIWTYAFGSNPPPVPGNWQKIDEEQFPDVRPYVGTTIYVDEYRVN